MAAMTAMDWSSAKKILCVRLDSLGDVLMCTPALRAIRQSHPERSITLLSSQSGIAVAPFIPDIDAVIAYPAPWMKSSISHDAAADLVLMNLLQSNHFDAAIIFTSYSQSPLPAAMTCYLAGIPRRLAHCRENPYQMLSDWIPEPEPQQRIRHEVRRQLDLVASVGYRASDEKLCFTVRGSDLAWMRSRLDATDADRDKPWILIHPGATAASRRYPAGHWSQVISQLTTRLACNVLLTGDVDEVPMIDTIIQSAKSGTTKSTIHSLAGELDLGQLGAAIALASVLISNNTGPAHMAAAIGTPLVDLYALTNPQHTPWLVPNRVLFHDVPCRFCYKSICPEGHHHCLSKVEPDRVVEAVLSLLNSLK